MDNVQVSRILRNDPITRPMFIGTFAADRLPINLPPRFALVANTEPSGVWEGHWTAVFSKSTSTVFFFDSLGEPPRKLLRKWLLRNFKRIVYSRHKQQRDDTVTCGGFCVKVLRELCRGQSFARVVEKFESIRNDDEYIQEFMYDIYKFRFVDDRIGQS